MFSTPNFVKYKNVDSSTVCRQEQLKYNHLLDRKQIECFVYVYKQHSKWATQGSGDSLNSDELSYFVIHMYCNNYGGVIPYRIAFACVYT